MQQVFARRGRREIRQREPRAPSGDSGTAEKFRVPRAGRGQGDKAGEVPMAHTDREGLTGPAEELDLTLQVEESEENAPAGREDRGAERD